MWNDVRKRLKARYDENNKLVKNVQNFGAKKNEIFSVERHGEYYGLKFKFEEDVKPLLTDFRVKKCFELFKKEEINSCVKKLHIEKEFQKYGIDLLHFIFENWFKKANINIPKEIICNKKINDNKINEWIDSDVSYIIPYKFSIIDIGSSKGKHSVVPESWLGKIFNNAKELHESIDKLEWRIGKPKCKYCCTYGIRLVENINLNKINDKDINLIFYINKKTFDVSFCTQIDYKSKIIIFGKNAICIPKKIIKENNNKNNKNISFLASKLQKCIRRGSESSKLLIETMDNLSKAGVYNLPELGYKKVSGIRQLFWRLYISTIEDVSPFIKNKNCFDILDIFIYAMIVHIDPSISFIDNVFKKFMYTGLLIQNFKENWNWRKGKITNEKILTNNRLILSMQLACDNMPMMKNDKILLQKGINYLNKYKPIKINDKNIKDLIKLSNEIKYKETNIASFDHHCYPNILILLQGCLNINDLLTTHEISSFIWENSSKINFRNEINIKNTNTLQILKNIQYRKIYGFNDINIKYNTHKTIGKIPNIKCDDDNIKRLSFLLLFGKTFILEKNNKYPLIEFTCGGGTKEHPFRIKKKSNNKYLDGKDLYENEKRCVDFLNESKKIKLEQLPFGYKWIFDKDPIIKTKIISSNNKTLINEIEFYVNNKKIKPFDGSDFIIKLQKPDENKIDKTIKKLILQYLYKKQFWNEYDMIYISKYIKNERIKFENHDVYDWIKYNNLSCEIWKLIKTKLFLGNIIQIAQVDRRGNKLDLALNYNYEGVIWRLLNMLMLLYPRCIIEKSEFIFELNKDVPEYLHLIDSINICEKYDIKLENKIINTKIKTKLWDHQEESINKIINGFKNGKKSFGDASYTGAGKTLTAISVYNELVNKFNIKNYCGCLILVPSKTLYETWINEIKKHTYGFEFIIYKKNFNAKINENTFVISTLATMRDNPYIYPWKLVVIDECLSVQNRDALQTEEACKQIINSKFLVMLSATFFRTRFDKLFYLLKMLRTNLPETKEYLNAILNESIICNIVNNTRKWITNVSKYELENNLMKKYDKIKQENINNKDKYIKLLKFIYDNVDYVTLFLDKINKMEKNDKNCKIVIYAKSKNEANEIVKKNKNISRYPKCDKKHVCASYAEATYGVNNLVKFNRILIRPIELDKIIQIKGRLDRPLNKNNILTLDYILLKNTIEEANLLNLEITNNFYKNHIIPLAKFYEIALKF